MSDRNADTTWEQGLVAVTSGMQALESVAPKKYWSYGVGVGPYSVV